MRSNREDVFNYFEETVDFGNGVTMASRHSAKMGCKHESTREREREWAVIIEKNTFLSKKFFENNIGR